MNVRHHIHHICIFKVMDERGHAQVLVRAELCQCSGDKVALVVGCPLIGWDMTFQEELDKNLGVVSDRKVSDVQLCK